MDPASISINEQKADPTKSSIMIESPTTRQIGTGFQPMIRLPRGQRSGRNFIIIINNSTGVAVSTGNGNAVTVTNSPSAGVGVGGASVVNSPP